MTRKCFAKFSEYEFYMGQSIQEQTKWNLWKTAFKIFEVMFLVQTQEWKHQKNVWNLFEVNKKDTRTTS